MNVVFLKKLGLKCFLKIKNDKKSINFHKLKIKVKCYHMRMKQFSNKVRLVSIILLKFGKF